MPRVSSSSGFLVGIVTSVLAVAVMLVGRNVGGLPFIPFDIFEWMTRMLPGGLVTTGIDAMVAVISALGIGPTSVAAKLAEQGLAVATFIAGSAVLGALAAATQRHSSSRATAVLAGLSAGAVWVVLESIALASRGAATTSRLAWIAIVLLGWGALLGAALGARARIEPADHEGRRSFLRVFFGGVAGASVVLFGIALLGARRHRDGARGTAARTSPGRQRSAPVTSGPAASPPAEALARRVMPVHGTRPELTTNEAFYRIDINLEPPHVDAQSWRLDIGGLVDHPQRLTLDDLRAMPSITQVITLECISNRLGGDLISTAPWTGVRLKDVLARAGVRADARAVHIRAADGFYESVGGDDIADDRTLLVYAMNGVPLPDAHGFPLRIYIPNRHGMKQPKWITHLRVADRDGPGYWVDRGWSKDAIPNTTSVIDTVGTSMMLGTARVVPVGGIAYAGARGISKVEVQVDREPWRAATLITPPQSPLTWVLWRYDWPYTPGKHTFRVRAYDGTGALQPTREAPPHPSGVAGIHTLTTRI